MAKRFTDTDKWKDDWYLSLNNDNRIVWQWLLDNCNHAGICKKSITLLNLMCNTKLAAKDIVVIFEDRILETDNHWFIPKFLKFQYSTLQSKKPAIISVVNELKKGNYYLMIPKSFGNDYFIIKDKDKDKDKDNLSTSVKISLGVQDMAKKYLEIQREQIDLIQMNVLRQKNDPLFTDLLWCFCLEQIGKVNEHTSYSDFVKHVWNWFNHDKFNAENKLKLKTW